MLDLLISILMSLNIHYTVIDGKQIQISKSDAEILVNSSDYQKSETSIQFGEIIIVDEVDPTSNTDTKN